MMVLEGNIKHRRPRMVSMCSALQTVKDDPFAVLSASVIEDVCRQLGHTWRDGALKPAHAVALFVQQIAAGNVSCSHVRHLRGPGMRSFSAPGYCQARQRLPLAVLQELSRRVFDAAVATRRSKRSAKRRAPDDPFTWRGHRTWLNDGSTFSMPDTAALQNHFGQPRGQKPGCGFPVAHVLAMFDLHTGLLAEPVASPLYTSDLRHTPAMHAQMQEGDLLLGDDTFSTYSHFARLLQGKFHGLMPNHHKRIVDFKRGRPHRRPGDSKGPAGRPSSRWIKSLGHDDQLVEWFKPVECPRGMTPEDYARIPESIVVREIRRTVRRKGFQPIVVVIVTTLLDPQVYPADELIELRMRRWRVETHLAELKTTMGMDVLHCQSVDGVLKEMAVFVLVYNLVRALMMHAAATQGVALDRISFSDALYWLRHARPGDRLPTLLCVPYRPGRVEPRAIKRRPKPYDLLTRPRAELQRELREGLKNKGKTS
jgi:hypothetical protein